MKKSLWISFDFGMKGDYEGLYRWLDLHNALERGYGLALIKEINIPHNKSNNDDSFKKYIFQEIKKNVRIGKADRMYMIWKSIENETRIKGGFLSGGSKSAPWKGHSQINEDEVDMDLE